MAQDYFPSAVIAEAARVARLQAKLTPRIPYSGAPADSAWYSATYLPASKTQQQYPRRKR